MYENITINLIWVKLILNIISSFDSGEIERNMVSRDITGHLLKNK
jgi:hypothetical protein